MRLFFTVEQRWGHKRARDRSGVLFPIGRIAVVYVCRLTPVKIFYRLRLQNLFPGVSLHTVVRVRARGSRVSCMSKGAGQGFNV